MKITGYLDMTAFAKTLKAMPKEVRKEVRRELKRCAEIVVSRAKQLAPVDTGLLRSKITSRQAQYNRGKIMNDMMYEIHVNVPYASFNELGTRFMSARPFLRPAIHQSHDEIAAILKEAFRNGLNKSLTGGGISITSSTANILDYVSFD